MNEDHQTASADIPASVAMLRMISGFWVSRAIYVAAQLGLADLLKEGPKSCEEIVHATATHAASLYRLLRVLASMGIFAQDQQGRFALTALGATLQTDVPGSLRAWALLQLGEEKYQAWGDLMHSVRTGDNAFEHIFGSGVWQYRAQRPEQARIFDEAMANLTGMYNAAVLASYPFSTIDKVVDIGGGDGSLIISLLRANPKMKGVLFDLPHVAERASQRIAKAGLVGRCEVVSGDVFASVPDRGDAYILSRIVNSFDHDRAVALLKNCYRAMREKVKLLLVQGVLPDRVGPSIDVQALVMSDLNMMVTVGGRERTETEYRALLEAAGFRLTNIIPTQSDMTVIECTRA